jgi:hypothetical protein
MRFVLVRGVIAFALAVTTGTPPEEEMKPASVLREKHG